MRMCILGVVFILSLLHSTSVYAAASYTVTPLVIDTKANARDIIKKTITLTNTGTQPVTIYPTVNNISRNDEGKMEAFIAPVESDRTQSLASWIEISRQGIDIPIGGTKTVDMTLHIHPSPVVGVYHAFLGFGTGNNRDEAEAQVKNGQAPGSMVTVTIEEKKNESLKLAKFVVRRFVTNDDNHAASYTFTNPGDEPLTPQGEIIIFNAKGDEVNTVPVNEEKITIQPGEEHVFTVSLPMKGMFGKYKAFLTVEYGNTQKGSVQDTSFFYVFPLKILFSILGVLILMTGIVAWRFHKKYFDEAVDDSERLTFHIRESQSESKDHDIDLKQKT